jgi:glycosyltransferase involved in cell wall biosynthesis
MKLSLLCSDLGFGGIQRVALLLADGLATRDDLSVELAVLRGGGEFMSAHSPAVSAVDLACTSQPLAALLPSSRLVGYFRTARPDAVISFGHSTNCLVAWAKLTRRLGFRLIVTEHSAFGARMANDSKFHQRRRVVRARFLYKEAELCVCVSEGVADELVGLDVVPREKTRVIYNPVQGRWLSVQMRESADHPWFRGPDAGRCVVMSVGRLLPLKGLDTLIYAFSRLRRELGVDARLMIVGEGPDRERLEALSAGLGLGEDVCFVGYVQNPCAYMARASVVVLSSHYEGFSSVLVEAMACGVNVVSTDCKSGPGEILEDGKWGRLTPVGDSYAMAEAIFETLKSPLPAEELKMRASYFSTERAVDAYYDVIGRRGPASADGDGRR